MKNTLWLLCGLLTSIAFANERCNLASIRSEALKLYDSSKRFSRLIDDVPAYKHLWREANRVFDEASHLKGSSQCTVAVINFRDRLTPPYITLEGKYLQAAKHNPEPVLERAWNLVEKDYQSLRAAFNR